ncbi:MAG: hypothetical protein ACLTK0_02340 [Anaerovoracaceae bacterium]
MEPDGNYILEADITVEQSYEGFEELLTATAIRLPLIYRHPEKTLDCSKPS